ncbi:MAG: hypothetical protein AAFQ53_03970 [Bacteroidota bacterium]
MHDITPIWLTRNYITYGLMAGVRGPEQLFEPRGFPDGLQEGYIHREFASYGGYEPSWLTTQEIEAVHHHLMVWYDKHTDNPYLVEARPGFDLEVTAVLGAMRAVDAWCNLHDPGGQALLVFYFD